MARRRQATTRHKAPGIGYPLPLPQGQGDQFQRDLQPRKGGFVACRNWQMLSAHFSLITLVGARGRGCYLLRAIRYQLKGPINRASTFYASPALSMWTDEPKQNKTKHKKPKLKSRASAINFYTQHFRENR